MREQHILNEVIKEIPEIFAQWEIFFLKRKVYSVEGKDLKVDKKRVASQEFFSIRVIKDKKAGFATCGQKDKIKEAFFSALNITRASDPDEFLILPEPGQMVENVLYDEELINKKDSLPEFLLNMQISALFDRRIKKLRNAEITVTVDEKGVVNSKGIGVYEPSTTCSAYIVAVAEDVDSQTGWSYRAERFIKNISFENIGREAGSNALILLNSKKIKPFRGQTVFSPFVSAQFLGLIAQSLSAENYQKGKSLFTGRIGQTVIGESLSIIDDGLMPERFGSTSFDAEGVATSKKILIERGILKLLMHNTYTAYREGANSTGNAVRIDGGIGVGPTNLYIDTEVKLNPEDLIKQVERGVYVIEVMGMHTANPVSGDFSVGISGVYIENGQMKHSVKETVISGNVMEVFKNIKAAGNDMRFFGNIGSPTLLVEGVDISG